MPDRSDAPWAGVDLPAIWAASQDVLRHQVAVVEAAVVAGIERRLTLEQQIAAGREAHKLAGSLGTFGFTAGSRLARTLELALASSEVIGPLDALELSRSVMELQADMARPVGPPAPRESPGQAPQSVLVVDSSADRPRRVVEAAAAQGVRASVATSLSGARESIDTAPPGVVVLDADTGTVAEVDAFLAELAGRRPPVATVVLVGTAGLQERVQAARVGAHTVLELPAPPDRIVEAVTRLLARERATTTVLAVDDDPLFLDIVGEFLRAEGIDVQTLEETENIFDRLAEIEPDLLLLDNQMPGVDGLSLCRAIRSDERWARLPVVFLSGSQSPDVVRQMFAAGADDFVAKPVAPDDLVTRVVSRIERVRAQAERADVDLATGLPSARAFVGEAGRLLALGQQYGRTAVLAVAELDPRTDAAASGFGRILRHATEAGDAVGAWSGGRLAALLYDVSPAGAEARLSRLLAAARALPAAPARISLGMAVFPDDGLDIRVLGTAAEDALGQARQARTHAVVRYESPALGRTEVVDVLVVEDDEALGNLVVHALSTRGWTVRWLKDGAEAAALLDEAGFRARAVLLDVGLPGLDGLSVLRHMNRKGLLRRTQVVMLTVRANEGEVLEALDLGAFDHVAKPFSLPVLMHRVRRAVDAAT